MLVDVQLSQTYSNRVTIYQICSHKEYLPGAQGTCNWEFQQPSKDTVTKLVKKMDEKQQRKGKKLSVIVLDTEISQT